MACFTPLAKTICALRCGDVGNAGRHVIDAALKRIDGTGRQARLILTTLARPLSDNCDQIIARLGESKRAAERHPKSSFSVDRHTER
jgi:hypothetical protein